MFSQFLVQVVETTVEILQLPGFSRQVVDMPAVVNDRCPMVQDFTVAALLKGGRCPVCACRVGHSYMRGGDSRDPTVAGRREFPHFMAVAVGKEFFARFTGIFRTPSTWMSSARFATIFFEPSMANSCRRGFLLQLRLLS